MRREGMRDRLHAVMCDEVAIALAARERQTSRGANFRGDHPAASSADQSSFTRVRPGERLLTNAAG